jgi:hypothetical protein
MRARSEQIDDIARVAEVVARTTTWVRRENGAIDLARTASRAARATSPCCIQLT